MRRRRSPDRGRGTGLQIRYSAEADALYIGLGKVRPRNSTDIEEGVTVDLDEGGHIIGIEVLDARERLGVEPLFPVHVEELFEGTTVRVPRPTQDQQRRGG